MNGTTQSFKIGDRRVNLAASALWGPGGVHHLSPEMIGVLETLAKHAGEPIGRDCIIDDVWQGDRQANRSLTRCVSSLRRYLGDNPKNPHYIETIPGYGYRLIAPVPPLLEPPAGDIVETVEPGAPIRTSRVWPFLLELRQRKVCRAALFYAVVVWLIIQIAEVVFTALRFPDWAHAFVVVAGVLGFPIALILAWTFEITPSGLVLDIPRTDKEPARRPKQDNRWNSVLLAASALISFQMLASGFGGMHSDDDGTEQLRNAESIVVTPFRATSVNLETKAYAFGLSEQLRYLLGSEMGLIVIAADASANLTNDQKKADLLLEGSVTITQHNTRVIVHLVDPIDGHDLWSDMIHTSGTSTTSAQYQLAQEILTLLPIGQVDVGENTESLVAKAHESH